MRSVNTPEQSKPSNVRGCEEHSLMVGNHTPLERGFAVIQAFSSQRSWMSAAELSLKTGIPRAAIGRCLYTLGKLGFIRRMDNHYFALTSKVLQLGHIYLASAPLANTSISVLRTVSAQLNESCSLTVLDGDNIRYVARATCSRLIQTELGQGKRLPAYCTSMGRVLLSNKNQTDIEAYLSRVKIVRHTSLTKVSISALHRELEIVRSQGYALIDQELEVGLRSIAVPIYASDGTVPAALNIGVHAERVTVAEMELNFLPVLQEAASELGLLLI